MPDTEEITLHTAGTIPGFPGGIYGAGRYLLNWVERTVTRIEDVVMPEPATSDEPAPAESAPVADPAPKKKQK